jgi:DNA-binding MarR family transcriptional regulator
LEEKGFVQRRQDPTDGRAWIFELTPKGIAYRKKGLEIIANLERKWAKTLGEYEYVQLKQYLAKLNKVITEEKN